MDPARGTPRPIAITGVSILLIAAGAISLPLKLLTFLSPDAYRLFLEFFEILNAQALIAIPVEVQLGHAVISSVVWIGGGILMLMRRDWARWVVLVWGIAALFLHVATAGITFRFYLKAPLYLVMAYFLFNSRAAAYFSGGVENAEKDRT